MPLSHDRGILLMATGSGEGDGAVEALDCAVVGIRVPDTDRWLGREFEAELVQP